MFESEVQEIKEALKNTLEIYQEMQNLRSKYNNLDKKLSLDLYSRTYENAIYNDALRLLNCNITTKTGLKQFSFPHIGYNDNAQKILEESYSKALSINNQTILDYFKTFLKTRYSYEKKEKFTINKDTIELQLDFNYHRKIILNCINILKNGCVEELEIFEKISEVLKKDNTFVYRDIKITAYKNGKTKLVFACNKFKDKFIKELINV